MNEIAINMALPLQFAIGIFGGCNELNSFIKPKKNEKDTFMALRRAAWDLSYIQLIHQYNGTRSEEKSNCCPQYILVTDDEPCSRVGKLLATISAVKYGDSIYNGVMMSSDFPHLTDIYSFLAEIVSKQNFQLNKRVIARTSKSQEELNNEVLRIINKSRSLILELTKQIKLRENKGFG